MATFPTGQCPAHQPDGSCVPRDPTNPQLNQCLQVPLPIYALPPLAETQASHQPRIPHSDRGPVMIDFLMTSASTPHSTRPVEAKPEGFASLTGLSMVALSSTTALPGRHSWHRGRFPPGHPPHLRNQLCPAHVARRRAFGHHARHQRARPALLAYNPLRLYESPYCNSVLLGGNKAAARLS